MTALIHNSTTARQYKFKSLIFCLFKFVNQQGFKSISSANKRLLFQSGIIFSMGGSFCSALSILIDFQEIN